MISQKQYDIIKNATDFKQGRISVYVYDNERISIVVELLEKGLVKEGRPSTVAPYRRFSVTKLGKNEIKQYESGSTAETGRF